MMHLTPKQQLICLQILGLSYKDQWLYLTTLHRKGLMDRSLTWSECRQVTTRINGFNSKRRTIGQTFPLDESYIKLLDNESFYIHDEIYPKLWLQIPQPPLVIYFRGRLDLFHLPSISIVGTRKISAYGEFQTQDIVKELANLGLTFVSGLAAGVDYHAHLAALKHAKGSTIAILANGMDYYYPQKHEYLQRQLGQEGLVLSEYLPDCPCRKHQFIMRNRLVAGLSPAILVIEAAMQSGSLITANYALDYNRQVFALPGRIDESQSQGCNALIAAGAYPIISTSDLKMQVSDLYLRQGQFHGYFSK